MTGEAPGRASGRSRGRWWPEPAVAAVCVAMAVVGLSTTAVGVASRGIADEVDVSLQALSWIVGGYLVAAATFALVGGRLGDVIGRTRTYLIGIAVFGGGALLAALSPGSGTLIAARIAQGIGAALIVPASIEIVAAHPPSGGPRAGFRLRGLVYAVSFGIGPLIGGVLTDYVSWRAIFWLELALLVVAAVLTIPLLLDPSDLPRPRTRDLAGAVLSSTVVLVGIVSAYGIESWGWLSWPTAVAAVLLATLVALLLRVESRAADPMLHRALWRSRLVLGANVATIAASVGMLGLIYFFGLFAQSAAVFDSPAASVAAALAPFALSIVLFAYFSEFLARHLGYWGPVLTGLGITVVGFGWLSTTTAGTTEAQLVVPLALCGVGAGIANGGLTGVAVMSEGHDRVDEAAGMLSLSRFLGSALAIAIGTTTYLSVASGRPPLEGVEAAHPPDEVAIGGSAFHEVVAQLRRDLRGPFEAAARSRSAEAFATTMRLAAVVLLLLTLLSVWLLRPTRESPNWS
ncbi:MAG: MFS transporter [Acidimicrobiales bacterium]